MKKIQIYLFITSLIIPIQMVFSQVENQLNDSLIEKNKTLNLDKIRLGFDIFKPIKSSSEGDNLNYEIVGDLQITENLYLAAEYGLIDRLIEDENINLEDSVKSFEEGINLVKECQKKLQEAELKIKKLLDDGTSVDLEDQ